jgi:hypothetical protein
MFEHRRLLTQLSVPLAALLLTTACVNWLSHGELESFTVWKELASEVRELPFLEQVGSRWISREELRQIVKEELQAEYAAEYVESYRDAYAAMGLLPPGLDLLEVLLDLLQDQLVGLYSVNRGTLYVVKGAKAADDGSSEMIAIHELVHALQHQHYPVTLQLLQRLRDNDDLEIAMASGVEGDASLTMLGSDPNGPLRRDMEHALWFQRELLDELQRPSRVPGVPRLLRVAQSFPYAYGTPAAAAIYRERGNPGLDAQLRDPPLASLRIRFPDEDHPIEFLRLPLEALRPTLADRGCEVRHSNVAGIVTIGVLLEAYGADDASETLLREWSGDRFIHVTCPGAWELGWVSRWTTPVAAADFARRYRLLADEVGAASQLSGPPDVFHSDRTVVVLTPGLLDLATLFLEGSEHRAYNSFLGWLDDGCFPESSCVERAQRGGASLESPR